MQALSEASTGRFLPTTGGDVCDFKGGGGWGTRQPPPPRP